ncbi:Hypothetical_protein [Hexamita inflata]|uniref:Hypothetical_protein n=1 Tax=Hexamita inflata TaxID=28002 RepID=A0AA86R4Q5_9EUKA|nr:Hypothetical protein HINF_LOCUS54686 [Hexamita inflata]
MHSPSRQTEERVKEKTSSKTVDPIETENTFQKVVFVERRILAGLIDIYQYSNYSILFKTENTDFKKFHTIFVLIISFSKMTCKLQKESTSNKLKTLLIQLKNQYESRQSQIKQITSISAQIIICKQQTVYEARIQIFIPK